MTQPRTRSSRRAIVISVDAGFRSRVGSLLEGHGFEVFATALPGVAGVGLGALSRSGLALPGLVVVDCRDPAAVEVAATLAKDPTLRGVRAVTLSESDVALGAVRLSSAVAAAAASVAVAVAVVARGRTRSR